MKADDHEKTLQIGFEEMVFDNKTPEEIIEAAYQKVRQGLAVELILSPG